MLKTLINIIHSGRPPTPCSPTEWCRLKIPYRPQMKNRYLHSCPLIFCCLSCMIAPVTCLWFPVWRPPFPTALQQTYTLSYVEQFPNSTITSCCFCSFWASACKIPQLAHICPWPHGWFCVYFDWCLVWYFRFLLTNLRLWHWAPRLQSLPDNNPKSFGCVHVVDGSPRLNAHSHNTHAISTARVRVSAHFSQ